MFALTLDKITTRWVIIVTSRKTPLLKSLTTRSLEIISQINQPVNSVFLLKNQLAVLSASQISPSKHAASYLCGENARGGTAVVEAKL
jgi:hypothetical protein